MKDHTLSELVTLVNEYTKQGLGIWARQKDDFTICLVGVADADTGQFIAAYLPCAKNSRRYQIGFDTLRELEKEGTEGAETPGIRVARLADNGQKHGS